jgi:hypothetical protein
MRLSRPWIFVGLALAVAVAALVWMIAGDRRSRSYSVDRSRLTGWTIVASEGDEPWVLALRPPETLAADLFTQFASRGGTTFEPLPHTALPLVLRTEFEEGLQGVYGVDTITQIARDAGVGAAALTPVCIGRRVDRERDAELVFVVFNSPEFQQMRNDLLPDFPEHAGTGIYDPATLTPILPFAERGGDFSRWWPLTVDPRTDCQAPLAERP